MDLDIARQGPRASYERCGQLRGRQAGADLCLTFSRRDVRSRAALPPTTLAAADYRIVDPHVHVWKHDPEFPFAPGRQCAGARRHAGDAAGTDEGQRGERER